MILTNNKILIGRDEEPYYSYFEKNLVKFEDDQFLSPYAYTEDGLEFGRGLMFLLKDYLPDIEDRSAETIRYPVSYDFSLYRNLLPGYTLREDQVVAIIKALECRRGILQMATGSGKSLCIAGILKYLTDRLGYTPPSLLLEPTNYLVSEMCERMNSYGIPAEPFTKQSDLSQNRLYISHPSGLCNLLEKNPGALRSIRILIADEAHHEHSMTWSRIYDNCPQVEISLGFSAYLVESHKIDSMSYGLLSYCEAKAIGCTGPVLLNLDTSYYIRLGVLATPVLIRMANRASEPVSNERDWQELRLARLESPSRLKVICETAKAFDRRGFKTLVLSNTKKFATDILSRLATDGLSDRAVCSFGSGEYVVSDSGGKLQSSRDDRYKAMFADGDISIMVCTSHMFEGADIPNLDVVILAEVGKKVRKIIQGVGRGLRKTKKGRYAYVVDFTDHEGGVLAYHSGLRMQYYKSLIGIDKICDNVPADLLGDVVDALESP